MVMAAARRFVLMSVFIFGANAFAAQGGGGGWSLGAFLGLVLVSVLRLLQRNESRLTNC